jgi:hypothetical protein
MLYREIIAVCSEINAEHINTIYGQNVEFLSVKPGDTYSNQWDVKGRIRGMTATTRSGFRTGWEGILTFFTLRNEICFSL